MGNNSKLRCTLHAFNFSDGSRVVWYPLDDSNKAHGLFRVGFQLKVPEGGIGISQEHKGPPTAKASLHLLKWVKKDQKTNK